MLARWLDLVCMPWTLLGASVNTSITISLSRLTQIWFYIFFRVFRLTQLDLNTIFCSGSSSSTFVPNNILAILWRCLYVLMVHCTFCTGIHLSSNDLLFFKLQNHFSKETDPHASETGTNLIIIFRLVVRKGFLWFDGLLASSNIVRHFFFSTPMNLKVGITEFY